MVLNKKEKNLMEYIYKCAQEKGECLITPIEILNNISFDLDFREEEIEPTMKALQAEQYFSYDHVYKNDQLIYAIVLKEKGICYERDKRTKRKKITQSLILAAVTALIGVLIRTIVAAITKK